jgi:hypothetical protein
MTILLSLLICIILYIIFNQNNKIVFNKIKDDIKSNNFLMDDKSILISQTKKYTKEECLAKPNKKEINGATYNLKTNECKLYFNANKGITDIGFESIIL